MTFACAGILAVATAAMAEIAVDSEVLYTLAEAKTVVESWRRRCNALRPHGLLGDKPPAPAPRPTLH